MTNKYKENQLLHFFWKYIFCFSKNLEI